MMLLGRRASLLVAFYLLVVGCAGPKMYTYNRGGATQTDISRDTFECAKEVKEMQRSDFVFGPLWFVVAAKSKAERHAAELMNLCMQGKGYTVQEQKSE